MRMKMSLAARPEASQLLLKSNKFSDQLAETNNMKAGRELGEF